MAEITHSLNVNTLNVSNTFVQQTSNVFPTTGSILVEPENHANRTIAIGNLLSDLTVTLEDPKRAGIRYHFVSSSQRINTGTLTFKTQTATNSFRGCVSNVSITALDSQEDDAGMGALRRLTLLKSLWQDHGGNITVIRMGMSQRFTGFSVSLPSHPQTVAEPSVANAKKSN